MSSFSSFIHRSTETARATIMRFPFALAGALIATWIGLYLTKDINSEPDGPLVRWLLWSVYFTFVSVLVTLFVESQKLPKYALSLQILAVIDALVYVWILPADFENTKWVVLHMMRWFGSTLAVVIGITFIAYLRKKTDAQNFWHFLWELVARLVVTGFFTFVLWWGISLAIASLDFLFGIDINEAWYLRTWITTIGVFAPLFFLAGVPDVFDLKKQEFPRFLRILTLYIGLPIVAVYLLILYAYSAKILLLQEWPDGQVVVMMLTFFLIGFGVTLLSYPLQFIEKSPVFPWLQKIFFIAILPLMVVYFMSINIRIGHYGWTDDRYIVVAFGVWIVLSSLLYFLKKRDIRWIFWLFSVMVILSVWMPVVNMFDVWIRSQQARLETILTENNLFTDEGKIVASPEKLQLDDDVMSIIQYLYDRDGIDPFLARLETPVDDKTYSSGWDFANSLLTSLNIESYYVQYPEEKNIIRIETTENRENIDIRGFSTMLKFSDWVKDAPLGEVSSLDGYILTVGSGVPRSIDLGKIILDQYNAGNPLHSYDGSFENGQKYRLIFDSVYGTYDTNKQEWQYLSYQGWLLME